MLIAYHPMYPKLLHRLVSIMGPKGMSAYAEDTGLTVQQLQTFAETQDIQPIAEHIPVMWSKAFDKASPVQALAIVQELEE